MAGIAFLALYDSVFKDEIDFNKVNPANDKENLQRAFDLFEQKLSVPQLIKPEDVTVHRILMHPRVSHFSCEYVGEGGHLSIRSA